MLPCQIRIPAAIYAEEVISYGLEVNHDLLTR
jgi:hypothetical protein